MKKRKKFTRSEELQKSINWIINGHKTVLIRKGFKSQLERLLNIKLKHLTGIKYRIYKDN